MKIKKIGCVCAAAVCVAIIGIIAAALNPSLQTKIASSVLEGKFAGAKIQKLDAGISSISVDGLELPLPDGTKIALKSAKIKYSLSGLISKKVGIDSAAFAGVEIKMPAKSEKSGGVAESAKKITASSSDEKSQTKAAVESPQEENGGGIMQTLSQWEFELGKLEADIAVIAPDNSKASAKILVSGVLIENGLKPMSGTLNIEITSDSADFGKNKISAKAAVKGLEEGSKITFEVLGDRGTRVVAFEGTFFDNFARAETTARIDLSDADIAPLKPVLGTIPSFKSSVFAKTKYSDFGKSAQTEIVLKNELSSPSEINGSLAFLGPCEFSGELSAALKNGGVEIPKLKAFLSENSKTLLSLSLPEPVKISLSPKNSKEIPGGKIECVAAFPSATVSRAVKNFADFSSSDICGKLLLEVANNKIYLKTVSPIAASGVNLSKDGEVFLKDIGAKLSLSAESDFLANIKAAAELTAGDTLKESATIKATVDMNAGKIAAGLSAKGSITPFATRIYSVANLAEYGISIDLTSSATIDGETATLEKFSFLAFDKNGKQTAKILSDSPISINLATKEISPKSKNLLSFEVAEFPFSPIKPFAAGADAKWISIKGTVSEPKKSQFSVNAEAALESLYLNLGSEKFLADVSVKAGIAADIPSDFTKVEAKIKNCTISSGGIECATADAFFKAALAPQFALGGAEANFMVSLPALLSQPGLLKFANVSAGNLTLSAGADSSKISAKLRIDNLKTRSADGVLDNVQAEISAPIGKNFKITEAAAEYTSNSVRGKTSATLKVSDSDFLDINLDAKTFVVEDAMILAKAFSNPNAEASQIAASGSNGKKKIVRPREAKEIGSQSTREKSDIFAPKDSKAFWNVGRKIRANAKIGEVLMDARILLSNADISLSADESLLCLKISKAALLDASLSGDAEIFFDASAAAPYTARKISAKLENFESSKIFADEKYPLLSGLFNASISASGSGNNSSHLFQYLTGSAEIKGSGGRLLLLKPDTVAGATAGLAGTALKITGAVLDKKEGIVSGIGDIASLLSKIEYESVDLKLSRNSQTYDFNIVSAQIKTPDMLFDASNGKIVYNPDKPFGESDIDIPVNILVFDTPTQKVFASAGFAKNKSDKVKDAYEALSFKIFGTVSKPENDLMQALLGKRENKSDDSTQAIKNLGNSIFNSLFKRDK